MHRYVEHRYVAAVAALVIVACAAARTARAQECDARCWYQRGAAAFERADYEAATAAFRESYGRQRAPRILRNIALAEEQRGEPVAAIEAWESFLRDATDVREADRVEATEAVARLQRLVGEVRIVVRPDGAAVRIDDREVGRSPLAEPLRLRVGPHRVEATLADHTDARRSVDVVAGPQTVELTLSRVAGTRAVRARSRVLPSTPRTTRRDRDRDRDETDDGGFVGSPLFWGIVGAVVVGAGVTVGVVVATSGDPDPVLGFPSLRASE